MVHTYVFLIDLGRKKMRQTTRCKRVIEGNKKKIHLLTGKISDPKLIVYLTWCFIVLEMQKRLKSKKKTNNESIVFPIKICIILNYPVADPSCKARQ